MSDARTPYRSYLLRLWQAHTSAGLAWRASLEDAHTGERRGFADLTQMIAFLQSQVAHDVEIIGENNDNAGTYNRP